MTLSLLYVALSIALCIFCAIAAIYHIFRSIHGREQLVTHAEDNGADPEVLSDPMHRKSILVRWADRYDRSPIAAKDRERLRRAYLSWRPSTYRFFRVGITLGLFVFCVVLMQLPLVLGGIITAAFYFVAPGVFLKSRNDAFLKAFDSQIVQINQFLANGLRSGMSIHQAIGHLSESIDEPAKSEFQQTYHEILLGDDLVKALQALSDRVKSRDLSVMLDAIIVQHQAGGNLAQILHGMADALTSRQQLSDEINAMTASTRYGILVTTCIPIGFLILLRSSFLGRAIFDQPIGWLVLGIYAVLQTIVIIITRRVAKVEI